MGRKDGSKKGNPGHKHGRGARKRAAFWALRESIPFARVRELLAERMQTGFKTSKSSTESARPSST